MMLVDFNRWLKSKDKEYDRGNTEQSVAIQAVGCWSPTHDVNAAKPRATRPEESRNARANNKSSQVPNNS